jgi:hypothetical protein
MKAVSGVKNTMLPAWVHGTVDVVNTVMTVSGDTYLKNELIKLLTEFPKSSGNPLSLRG